MHGPVSDNFTRGFCVYVRLRFEKLTTSKYNIEKSFHSKYSLLYLDFFSQYMYTIFGILENI